MIAAARDADPPVIPRRELVTLVAYIETGSHRLGARRLGISESTSRQRISSLIQRLGVQTTAQVVWTMRDVLELERRERLNGRKEVTIRQSGPQI